MDVSKARPGDIIEVDGPRAKGSDGLAVAVSRYHALVLDNPGVPPSGPKVVRLQVRRLEGGRSFEVRSSLVIGHWIATKATARRSLTHG